MPQSFVSSNVSVTLSVFQHFVGRAPSWRDWVQAIRTGTGKCAQGVQARNRSDRVLTLRKNGSCEITQGLFETFGRERKELCD